MEFATPLEGPGMDVYFVDLQGCTDHVYCIAASPDGRYLAAVLGDGALLFLNPNNLHVLQRVESFKPYCDLPCTSVRWLSQNEEEYKLVSVSSGGGVFVWRWAGESVECISKTSEPGNEILSLAVCSKGDSFITAGTDRVLRLYDADGKLKNILCKGFDEKGLSRATHTNRVFSVQYVTSNVVVSGGWSTPIQVWDMRNLESRQQIPGTVIAADSIEPIPDTAFFLVTSKRTEQQLQVFNCITASEMEEESSRISSTMQDMIPIKSKFCKKSSLLWIITSKPYKVLVVSFTTGELMASFDSPVPLVNIEVLENIPRRAFVSCAGGKILVAMLKL